MGIQLFWNNLFSSLLFITIAFSVAEENFFQSITELIFVHVPLDPAVHTYGDRSRFFTHHDGHRIALFGESDGSPMTNFISFSSL